MKSIDGGFEKKGIHEGDEGLYGKSSYADEDIELESADDFKGALDALELTDDTPELFSANDFGRAGFGDKHFVFEADRISAKDVDEEFEKKAKSMESKLDDLFK